MNTEHLGIVSNHPLANLEAPDVFAHSSDNTNNFVTWDQWKFGKKLAYTDVSTNPESRMATKICMLAFIKTNKRWEVW